MNADEKMGCLAALLLVCLIIGSCNNKHTYSPPSEYNFLEEVDAHYLHDKGYSREEIDSIIKVNRIHDKN